MKKQLIALLLLTSIGSIRPVSYVQIHRDYDIFDAFEEHFLETFNHMFHCCTHTKSNHTPQAQTKKLWNMYINELTSEKVRGIELLIKDRSPQSITVQYDNGTLYAKLDNLEIHLKSRNNQLMLKASEVIETQDANDNQTYTHNTNIFQKIFRLEEDIELENASSKYNKAEKTFSLIIPYKKTNAKTIDVEIIDVEETSAEHTEELQIDIK